MNKIFKTVWSKTKQCYVVASELTGGGAKSASSSNAKDVSAIEQQERTQACPAIVRAIAAVVVMAGAAAPHMSLAASTCDTGTSGQSSVASGGSCTLPTYSPTVNSQGIGAAVVSGGDSVSLSGVPNFQVGSTGLGTVIASTVTPISGSFNSSYVNLGAQATPVSGPNAATGTNVVFSTYNSANFAAVSNLNTTITQYSNVNGQEYINTSLGSVSASGGTLNVNLGSSPSSSPSTNTIDLTAKQSYLVSADGTGSAASNILWQSRNSINMGLDPGLPTIGATGDLSTTIPVTTYAGSVTFEGTTYTVTNAAQLASYNNALVAALQNGSLTSQSAYNAAFNQAFTTTDQTVTYASNTTAGDEVRAATGDRYAILVNGANANATIASGGQIDITNATGAVKATNGAAVVNNGILSGNIINQVAEIESGASFTNSSTGVVSAGYQVGNNLNTATTSTFYYTGLGIVGTGTGTTIQNNGVVNAAGITAAGNSSIGISVNYGAAATNNGIINVDVNPGYSTPVFGVSTDASSTFTNAANGMIYIGRAAQYSLTDPSVDVAVNGPSYGIAIMNSGGVASNLGTVTIGSLAQNAIAMYSNAASGASLVNSGTININGAAGGIPLNNIGMEAQDNGTAAAASVVENGAGGSINVDGVNGIGIKVIADAGQSANALSNGAINVNGGANPSTGTRNFGMWVDGVGAVGTINGLLNLTGAGAIGAFAQDGATINVANNAVFVGGADQIGFYASGVGSSINVSAQNLGVNTQGSTLFRVANGAAYTGSSAAGTLNLTVSGTDARGVIATGAGTTMATGASSYTVSGSAGSAGGAIALVDEGGATGTIDAATTINLNSSGAIAGLVDGQAHDLTGAASGAPVATTLTNQATLTSSSAGVTGFIAQNLGTLVNTGNIQLGGAGATGVAIGAQGTVNNSAVIAVANGTGALVQGAGASLLNSGTISADNGTAAIRLTGAGASLSLSGAGQVNAGNTADGIQLDATDTAGTLTTKGSTIAVSGSGQGIDNLAAGATINLANTTLSASGAASNGIYSSGANANISVTGGSIASQSGDAIHVAGGQATVTVQGGATLSAGSGGLVNATGGSTVNFVASGETLVGNLLSDNTSTAGATLQNGTTLTGMVDPWTLNIDSSSTWNATANSTLTALNNAGTVAFTAPVGNVALAGSYKTITTDNYVGANGTLALNTYLASDNSPTDLLIINGGSATGTTGLKVNNSGGAGAATSGNGIEVVATSNGASTAAGAFHLAAPVQAGAYEYLLYQGSSSDAVNWYLRSDLESGTPPTATTTATSSAGNGALNPAAYRPAVVGYTMTPALNADYGFSTLGTLQQRVGDIASTAHQQSGNSNGVWGRIGGESLDADAMDRFSTDEHTYFAQFGKDWTLSQATQGGSTHAGVTVTIGSSSASFNDDLRSINPSLSTAAGSVETQAQSVGGYWTKYLQDDSYFDSVGQITHYGNHYVDSYGNGADQNGFGLALSEEVGKPFKLAGTSVAIEPQAQLMYQYLQLNGFSDSVSAVSATTTNALRGRLGVRIFRAQMENDTHTGAATPYFTADVLHDFLPAGQTTVGSTPFDSTLGRTWYEFGVGVSASMGHSGQLYANVNYGHNFGGQYRQTVYGQAGYRYSW